MSPSNRFAALIVAVTTCLSVSSAAARAIQPDPPAVQRESDPLESFNRKIFWFNDHVDTYVLKPVATGYDKVTPKRVQKSVSNFFANLRFPINLVNNVLQGKPLRAASELGRFGVNTTIGLLGFFDPASDWGLEPHDEDFGQTLGYWGLGTGPYLVLPFLGPSNPRDTVGLGVDSIAAVYPWFVAIQYTASAYTVQVINARAQVLKEVEQAKQAAFDYYVLVRNAYIQRRRALVKDQTEMSEQEEEELYHVETNNGP
jgi:phospholipid-binding lipoprotein MlaA